MARKIIVYDLYDLTGKVSETRSKPQAMKWKRFGELNRFHGRKRKYIKTRTVMVLDGHLLINAGSHI